jgi:hypothetical protein
MFEDEARSLSDAWKASRKKYSAAELQLQAEADGGRCAHQDALNAILRINDACGHVMQGSIPFDQVTDYLQAVPAFSLAKLLRAMRRQISRAALRIRHPNRDNVLDRKEALNGGQLSGQKERRRSKKVRDPKLEARDKWIYLRCCKRIPYKKVLAELSALSQRKDWEKIDSIQGIRSAAMNYAERHELPSIPNRQNL